MKNYRFENDLKAVPLDKGAGYCITKKSVYLQKPNAVLVSPQFQVVEEGNQRRVIKIEEEFNRSLKLLKDANKSTAEFDEKSRSCGAQPARLCSLAKVHKQGSPLRPILSFPGSCYENFPRFLSLSRWLEQLPGANIETSSQNERSCCQRQGIISFDLKSLYANVLVTESIQLAADFLFGQEIVPRVSKFF